MSLSKSVNFHIFRSSLTDQWANGWTKPHHACLQLEMALMAVAVMNMTNQALGQEHRCKKGYEVRIDRLTDMAIYITIKAALAVGKKS